MSDNNLLRSLLSVGGNIRPQVYNIDVTDPIVIDRPTNANLTGSTLNVIPNNQGKYAALRLTGSDITLKGGTIVGDRDHHQGTDGQWGFGIYVDGAKNVTLQANIITDCWGDGVYLGGNCQGVMVDGVACLRNRRQGMSIVSAQNVMIRNCTFGDTQGTRPQDGIDIEPDKGDVISDLTIIGNKFHNNAGAHIEIAAKRGTIHRVNIHGNTFVGNTQPLKVGGVPGVAAPSLLLKVMAFFGRYDKWPREITIA